MPDLTRKLISDAEIKEQVGLIFPDSVVLTTQFVIQSISQNVLDALCYQRSEICDKPIDQLSYGSALSDQLESKLRAGYFDEVQIELKTKSGAPILFGVSGFYMGLVADINGLIVLRFRNMEEINLMYDRLEARTAELDRFVYHAAHNVRGPLATIRGLINLSRFTKEEDELRALIEKMDHFAQHLDDKLYRLIFFAESDKGNECPDSKISFKKICEELRKKIDRENFDGEINFQNGLLKNEPLENGALIFALMQNLLSFLIDQPRQENSNLWIDLLPGHTHFEIIIRSEGLVFTPTIKEKLRHLNFGYSEILNTPELINCYAAKKIVFKLHGSISFTLVDPNQLIILIILPADSNQR